MPTLYIIFNDMSSLGRLFSRSRFKLSLLFIHSLYVGIFTPSGEPVSLHLLCCGPIAVDDHVITSDRRERGDLMPLRKGMRLPLSLLSSQRSLQQPRLVNYPGKYLLKERYYI
jgi:hypothetical protein